MKDIKKNKILNELLRISLSGDFDVLDTVFSKEQENVKHFYMHRVLLSRIVRQDNFLFLSSEEIVALTKLHVEIQNRRLRRYDGSTTPVPKMIYELYLRGYEKTDAIVEWVLQSSTNDYDPFGNCTRTNHWVPPSPLGNLLHLRRRHLISRTELEEKINQMHEAKRCQWKMEERQRALKKKAKEEQEAQEAALRAAKYAIQLQRQYYLSAKRRKFIESFNNTDPIQRLIFVAKDTERSIYFYPPEFARLSHGQVENIPDDIKKLLLEKLQSPPKSEWRKLAKSLHLQQNQKEEKDL